MLNRLCDRTRQDQTDSAGTLTSITTGTERVRMNMTTMFVITDLNLLNLLHPCHSILFVTQHFLNYHPKVWDDEKKPICGFDLRPRLIAITPSTFRLGKGSLITPWGNKQATLTDAQITSKQPGTGDKLTKAREERRYGKAGLVNIHTEIARQRESSCVNVREPVRPIYSSF